MRLVVTLLISLMVWIPAPGANAQPTCELTPLTLPLFEGTPVAQFATPASSAAVDAPDIEEVTAILEMYVACTNTGDPTLVWAMFTPRWFSTEFADSEEHYLPAFEYEIARGDLEVVNPLSLKSVDDMEVLDDGRVAVTATFTSAETEWTDTLILANVDGQWLIDDVVLVSPSE